VTESTQRVKLMPAIDQGQSLTVAFSLRQQKLGDELVIFLIFLSYVYIYFSV